MNMPFYRRVFSFCLRIPRNGMGLLYGRYMFTFLRKYQIVSQRGCTILKYYSYQQYMRAPVVPHLHQHLV